ncbi:anti-CBASS protein Acb1 family protein [Halomonas caseinilytica]|uniref:anti-CBASS protein Acb1 family protein n=1 Tax=Halomonas caseinilytica TaxID=438744 RepID=UPI000849203B|nr:anti-CBASS Acb1 family protein [Halomonas caseinilytica]
MGMIANVQNWRRSLFGGKMPTMSNDAKRATAWQDYGFPEQLDFENHYSMFRRNGIARAGVMRHVEKTWETDPWIVEGVQGDDPHKETRREREVSVLLQRLGFWNRVHAADWRNRVGRYAGLYLVFDDGLSPDQPVRGKVQLLKMQPLFEGQLEPQEFDTDATSPNYGNPVSYQFKPWVTGDDREARQALTIHHDRIHIIAEGADDDTIYGIPANEAGFNDLITIEKLIGAGGEGFWKTARGAFSLHATGDNGIDVEGLAQMFGVQTDEVGDKLNEVASDLSAGMDKLLMLGNMEAKALAYQLPQPEQFFAVTMQSYAASLSCPVPELIGQQIAQRSSDENSRAFAKTIMTRRRRTIGPNIEQLIAKLMRFGALPAFDFYVSWDDLTDATFEEKLGNAKSMSEANKSSVGTGEPPPFRANEIRDAAGYDADTDLDDDDDEPEGGNAGATDSSALDE